MSVQDFVNLLQQYADDESHGYNQANRWGPDYDCSSLIYTLAYKAGLLPNYKSAPTAGYTGSMLADFTANGWQAVEFDGNVYDMAPGDVVLNVANHVEGVVSSSVWIGARRDERHQYSGGQPGDQDGGEISRTSPYHYDSYPNDWDYVLIPPKGGTKVTEEKTEPKSIEWQFHTIGGGWTTIAGEIDAVRSTHDIRVKSEGESDFWAWLSDEKVDDFAGDYGKRIRALEVR